MFRQDTAGEWFNLAEGDRLKSARAFKAKGEPADTAEKIKDAQLHDVAPSTEHTRTTPSAFSATSINAGAAT